MLTARTRAGAKVIRVDMESPVSNVDDHDKIAQMHLLELQNDIAELEAMLKSSDVSDIDGNAIWDAIKKGGEAILHKIPKAAKAVKTAITKKPAIDLYIEKMDVFIKILMDFLTVLTQLLVSTQASHSRKTVPDTQPDTTPDDDGNPTTNEAHMGTRGVFYVLRDD